MQHFPSHVLSFAKYLYIGVIAQENQTWCCNAEAQALCRGRCCADGYATSVPKYLQDGELFKSMQSEASLTEDKSSHDTEQIEVPVNYIKPDQTVNSVDDAWSLLHSLRYWFAGTDLPTSLVAFCLSPGGNELPASFWDTFVPQFPSLSALQRMSTDREKNAAGKVRIALQTGDIRLGRTAHEILRHLPITACSDAAKSGNLACLQYVHERVGRNLHQQVVDAAIEGGSLECLKFAVNQGHDISYDALEKAAEYGRLACLQYLSVYRKGIQYSQYSNVCAAAAGAGHLDCLKFAVDKLGLPRRNAMQSAAAGGHVACLEYLRAQGEAWNEETCSIAAQNGRIECLKFLHEHGCPWNAWTSTFAAMSASLACVQYAHEHGCPWYDHTCSVAARAGALDCLQYLHKHDCPWGRWTVYYATMYNHLPCLKYAHEHGCPLVNTSWIGGVKNACQEYLCKVT
jgi:hypothetical protein